MTRPKILAYYFPQYHSDLRNDERFRPGWTEWELVRAATPRFAGHAQPRVPSRGYEDESDPNVMADYIDMAADHGIDGFIFDYYWYDGMPYLHGALERGFLCATNRERLEFSLMWANHDWVDVFPSSHPEKPDALIYRGAVGRAQFETFVQYIVTNYFSQPNYTKIDGCPRFSIYEAGNLIRSLGGLAETRDALDWFDSVVKAAGFPGVHIDLIVWSFAVLPSEIAIADAAELIDALGARSASSYVWIHHLEHEHSPGAMPEQWAAVGDQAFAEYAHYRLTLPVPFHPNVTVGWDASPRCSADQELTLGRYPWHRSWNPSVAGFRHGLELARAFVDGAEHDYREVTINAWNEWTEGSYLLPDQMTGMAYLDAVRDVFAPEANIPVRLAEGPAS